MKTIILIPYRDRKSHLEYWLKHSYPILKKNIQNLEVLIIEQIERKKFNRGKIINVGYDYYKNKDYNYITQDVDVNPISERILNLYKNDCKKKTITAIYSDSNTLGGVIKFKGSLFEEINGFPNNFWGWGHEDKDIKNRVDFFNLSIERHIRFEDSTKKEHFLIFNDNHIREDCGKWALSYVLWDKASTIQQKEYITNNGLSTLTYSLLQEDKLENGVKKILVDI